mgnify:FL=1
MSKNLYAKIILDVVLVVAICFVFAWLYIISRQVVYIVAGSVFAFVVAYRLVRVLNSTNEKLGYFLEAVKNENSMLTFPQNAKNRVLVNVYKQLSNINAQIQQLKIESRQQEQYLQTLIENTATGIVTFNDKGFIIHANSAAKKMLGLHIFTHIRQLQKIDEKIFNIFSTIKPSEQRLTSLITEKNEVEISIKATSFVTAKDTLTIVALYDIKNELDERELESWMKLIRVLMHEIMNSISPIISLSDTLQKHYLTAENSPIDATQVNQSLVNITNKGLHVINEQSKGLISFVESYRKLTRLPAPDKKLFTFNSFAEKIHLIFNALGNTGNIVFNIHYKPDDMEMYADESMISQVVVNILKNAVQANMQNKNARISVVAGMGNNGKPYITISDNGPGIPAELLDQIFVPFFTTRESGSGIGLSLSKQIMRAHGGSLNVYSVPDVETRFTMWF